MLHSLHVKNLALIEETEVEFGEGLNILTGETGAGKSLIIGSLNLALGEKVPKEMLREHAEYALVELIFEVGSEYQRKMLEELSVFPEEGQVIMTRRITGTRSVGKINSESVSASKMKAVAALLIDIHGQHEHQSLLQKRKHLEILDEYAKDSLREKKLQMEEAYQRWSALVWEQKEAVTDESQRIRELSFLEYEIKEIADAKPLLGEDDDLEMEYKRLANGRKILEAVSVAYERIAGSRESASDSVGEALKEIASVGEYDTILTDLAQQLEETENLLNDCSRELSAYLSDTEFSEEDFEQVEKRLDELNRLKAKYGGSIAEVLRQKTEKEARYEALKDYEQYLEDLHQRLRQAETAMKDVSEEVSEIRKRQAKELTEEIKQALLELNFLDVNFVMDFVRTESYSINGIDDAQFMISTNPGEPVKPLGKIASGGELSRIMLAIKTILADNDVIETLIFDEIDAGISGRTAQMVAEKLNLLAGNHQVICITHLPQITAMADHHFLIEKTVVDQATISTLRRLDEEEKAEELARIIGGVEITDAVRSSAREMRTLANSLKNT